MLLELPALKIDSVELFSFIRANLFTGSFLKIHCVNLWLFFMCYELRLFSLFVLDIYSWLRRTIPQNVYKSQIHVLLLDY